MGVRCQILINKAREGVHRAGQRVAGTVKYEVDDKTEYQEVVLSLIGRGHCAWSERHGKSTSHYSGTEDCILHHINICDKKPDDIVVLHGVYQYPFEFYLPEDIPRSYKDKICSITYTIQLKFEKPSFFSFNEVFTAEIPVYNYMRPATDGPVIFGLDKTLFSMFASHTPKVNVRAEINKTCFVPGENVQLNWRLTNDSDVDITAVRADLQCYTTYTSDTGRIKALCDKVKSCEVETTEIAARSVFDYSCVVPTMPDLYSIDNSKVIKKEYKIRLTVRLPLPHVNATVEMPILVGEQKGCVEPAYEMQEECAGVDPPSYWEAMSEDKAAK